MTVAGREITVRFDVVGFHCWPEAKDLLPERAYLSDRHRHRFTFEVTVQTAHNDRDVEFHQLSDLLRGRFSGEPSHEFGRMSCEDLAEMAWGLVAEQWPNRCGRVTVWEDLEVGAALTFNQGPS